ncbi:hypothetical protein M3231_17260 [Neobacillus mesonae]|nr:hypothetical protein [Neobacillus mesonae]
MRSYDEQENQDIKKAELSREFEAYENLIHRHAADLFIAAYAVTRSKRFARALVSDALSLTWHQLKKEKLPADVVTALFQNALLCARRLDWTDGGIEASETSRMAEATVTAKESVFEEHSVQPLQMMRSNRSHHLEAAISGMSFERRAVFLLTFIADKPVSEIAKYINKSQKAALALLDAAMKDITREMREDKEAVSLPYIRKHFSKEREFIGSPEMMLEIESAFQKGLNNALGGILPEHRNRMRWRWPLAVPFIAAAVLFAILNPFREKETHDSLNYSGTRVVPDDTYIHSTDNDSYQRIRAEDGHFEALGYAMEWEDGSRLIIDGAMDVGSETLFWYTLEKGDAQDISSIVDGSILERSSLLLLGYLREQIILSVTEADEKGVVVFERANPTVSTEGALLQLDIDIQGDDPRMVTLETDFPHELEKPAKELALDQSFAVEDQTFHILGMTISSDYTRVMIKPDTQNKRGVESLKHIRLDQMKESGAWIGANVLEFADSDLIFPSIYYEEYTEIRLTMEDRLAGSDSVIHRNDPSYVQSSEEAETADSHEENNERAVENFLSEEGRISIPLLMNP